MGARFTREKMHQAKSQSSGGGQGFNWADLKVDRNTPAKQLTVRLIGIPFAYKEHSGYQFGYRDEDGVFHYDVADPATKKKTWVETGFHDDDQYEKKKYTRICTEGNKNFGACPWCDEATQHKYRVTQKFAQNILIRTPVKGPDGKAHFESEVAILNKGGALFLKGILNKEDEHKMKNEANGYDDDDPEAECINLGAENAHNIIIKAEFDPKQPNNPGYVVSVLKKNKISEEDIALLEAVGKPTPEELEAIYAEDESLRDFPEWYTYGYQFEKIYKPTPVKTTQATTTTAELEVSDDDETEAVPVARPATKKKTAPVVVVEEDDDDDDIAPGKGVEVDEDELDMVID